jgi:hypothetical protein
MDGAPCRHRAGWGTDTPGQGRCAEHDAAADARAQEQKKAFLERLRTGEVAMKSAAAAVGVDQSTIWRWRQEDEAFDAAVLTARASADAIRVGMVEDSLFRRIVLGEAAAAEVIFWLKNRAPDRWRDRQHIEHTGPGEGPMAVLTYVIHSARGEPIEDLT